MRKHSLLLSLLVLLFAIFTTACENSSTKGASISGPDQGIMLRPVLTVTATQLDGANYSFVGTLTGGNASDYTFTWNFGDGSENKIGADLEVTHTFNREGAFSVVLSAEPNNPDMTKPSDGVKTVTYTTSGILVSDIVMSNVSSPLDFSFQIIATSVDNSKLTYDWYFGDGTALINKDSIASHTYGKYNKTYNLMAVIKSSTGKLLNVGPVLVKTSGLKAVVSIVNNPLNTKNKTFSVNFYDENDNLVHGSSPSGNVEGLSNVVYNWDFGDNEYDNNTTSREVSHTYTSGATSKYTVTLTATTSSYDGTIKGTAEANVDLAYSIPLLTANLTGEYGLTLEASAQGNGGAAYANKEVTYRFTFPDGTSTSQKVTHDEEGNVASPVKVSTDLQKYFPNYNVTLEVLDNDVKIADASIFASKPTFEYALAITAGTSYKNKNFTVTPKNGSFTLKDATYNWNYGDNIVEDSNEPSVSHTYNTAGTFNVAVNISSPLLAETGITVKEVTGSISINSDITINSFNCKTDGAEHGYLQYTCSVDAVTSGDAPSYKWYVDDVLQDGQTGASFTKKYDKYNKVYNVKVEVGVQGISGVEPVTQVFQIGTPAVFATITGPDNLVHGETGTYTVTPKVTFDGNTIDVVLQNPNYTFKIQENGATENTGSSNTWNKTFEPLDNEYSDNKVTRTVSAVITASNINGGEITSSSKTTTISRLDSTLEHFQSAVVSCSPVNAINLVKQECKVTLTVKNGLQGLTGNFNQYKAKVISQGETKLVTFGDKAISAGASQVSSVVTFNYSWPNYGDVVTGQPKSNSYTVTGYAYKGDDENNKLNATSANIDVRIDVDYVLFPRTSGLEGKSGGSGYTFGTWSCGYNEKYGKGTLVGSKCASNQSVSGQTLKLGNFADENGNLKTRTKFEWYIRINKADGNNLPATLIKAFNVEAGQKPSDDDLQFNIVQAMGYKKFIGSAYNDTNNVFYLQITPLDDSSAQPIRVWYNGSNKTNHANRLQKITPTVRDDSSCAILYEYANKFYPTLRYIQYFITKLEYNFDGATRYNSTESLLPSSDYVMLRVNSNIFGIGTPGTMVWSRNYSDDYTAYRSLSGSNNGGWTFFMPDKLYKLNRYEDARGNTNIDIERTNANVTLVFKDMLNGSGNQIITDYYKPVSCSVSQLVH